MRRLELVFAPFLNRKFWLLIGRGFVFPFDFCGADRNDGVLV